MYNKKILYTIFFIINFSISIAQKENNIWYFGANAGIDFNSGSPIALTDGSLNTVEGCATICDNNGNLQFYTNGVSVWNKNHSIMPNGHNLKGHISSSQSAIIVQKPNSKTIYYIFTVNIIGSINGLSYSEVDMTLQNGLGDVNSNKNISIVNHPTDEKLTAIRHKNGLDFWIITHLNNSNTFHCYLLTSTGLNTTPVINNVGSFSNFSTVGYMKSSNNDKYLALANYNVNLELFDFDNTNGVISNPISIPVVGAPYYGIEFSPDNNLMYVSEVDIAITNVNQFNLNAGSANDIINSRIVIGTHFGSGGALQLAPDNKIYHARYSEDSLGVINYPDSLGLGCNYIENGFSLGGQTSWLGLPASIYLSFNINIGIDTILCQGEKLILDASLPNADYLWQDNSTDSIYVVNQTGTYWVEVTLNNIKVRDTIEVTYHSALPLKLGNDTTLCLEDSIVLNTEIGNATYQWQDSTTNPMITARNAGLYWVKVVYNDRCITSDSINILYKDCNTYTIPNIITPNNDGINDLFVSDIINGKSVWNLLIYNRWGELVHEELDYKNDWDARNLSDGVYYYMLTSQLNNSIIEHKGWVQVLR